MSIPLTLIAQKAGRNGNSFYYNLAKTRGQLDELEWKKQSGRVAFGLFSWRLWDTGIVNLVVRVCIH